MPLDTSTGIKIGSMIRHDVDGSCYLIRKKRQIDNVKQIGLVELDHESNLQISGEKFADTDIWYLLETVVIEKYTYVDVEMEQD